MTSYFRKTYQKTSIFILIILSIAVLVGCFLILEIKKTETEIQEILLSQISESFYLRIKEKPITLFFVGDIMLDRGVEYMIKNYGGGDYKFPFLKITEFLKKPIFCLAI